MLKQLICLLMTILCLSWAGGADAAPLKKKTVAVPPVTIACEGRWGNDAATLLHGELLSALVNSNLYEVLERTQLDTVMRELRLHNSGAIQGDTAIEFGQLTGAQYTVCATLYQADVGEVDSWIKATKAKVKLDLRLIDNKTGAILIDQMIEGTKTVSDLENRSENPRMLISRAVNEAADKIVEELRGTAVGCIIKTNADTVYIDIGANRGVAKRDRYAVYREGETLIHPVTNEIIAVEEIPIGEIVITEVKPQYAIGEIKKSQDTIQAGDKVRRIKKN